jgi:hypothetical protein
MNMHDDGNFAVANSGWFLIFRELAIYSGSRESGAGSLEY